MYEYVKKSEYAPVRKELAQIINHVPKASRFCNKKPPFMPKHKEQFLFDNIISLTQLFLQKFFNTFADFIEASGMIVGSLPDP